MGFINNLIVRIKGDNKDLDKKLKQSQGAMGKFGATVGKLGIAMAAAFSIGKLVQFGKELFNLAAKAEGIEKAFERMGDPNLINDLRRAVRGTVSDMELMQRAVMAKNFDIPMESLASLFEFAAKRAQDTGESIDYLVNSIVVGIGRKSPLILDNLGISLVRLREELKGVGTESAGVADVAAAVGRIAAESMKESGDIIETAQVKVERLAASWQNAKRSLGEFIAESGSLTRELDRLSAALDLLNNKTLTWMEKLAMFRHLDVDQYYDQMNKKQATLGQSTIELVNAFGNLNGEAAKFLKVQEKARQGGESHWQTLNTLGIKLEKLQEDLKNTNITHTGAIKIINKEIEATKKLIAEIENLGKAQEPTPVERSTYEAPTGQLATPTGTLPSADQLRAMGTEAGFAWKEGMLEAWVDAKNWDEMSLHLTDIMRAMTEELAQVIGDVVNMTFEAIGSGDFSDIGKNVLTSFADFLSQLGRMMVAYGVLHSAFFTAIKAGAVGGGIAIAAGLGAIAVAGLIKGAISNAGSAMGGSGGYSGASSGGGQSFQTQAMTIQVEGVLKGSDIAISSRRYSKDLTSKT